MEVKEREIANGEVQSTKFSETEKSEKESETENVIEPSHSDPPLTLKRMIVLCSLTLLWLSAAAPVFFLTASFCTIANVLG